MLLLKEPHVKKTFKCIKRSVLFLLQDMFYHFIALVFYFGAFVLEAATTSAAMLRTGGNDTCISRPKGNIVAFLSSREYNINVAATVSILPSKCFIFILFFIDDMVYDIHC